MSAELATRLKQARALLGLSQAQAAKAWEIPLPTIKAWEGSLRTPKGIALKLLLEKLDAILAAPPPPAAKPARKRAK